ncbi:hypothetical protein AB0D12_32170 [Streptomyces sp. NPDC048479]|uniref:hypothetical protein n=1 Tax=Streptomyces sp. NPDC048479 TaxID=3154725 RepID=UPI003434EF0D
MQGRTDPLRGVRLLAVEAVLDAVEVVDTDARRRQSLFGAQRIEGAGISPPARMSRFWICRRMPPSAGRLPCNRNGAFDLAPHSAADNVPRATRRGASPSPTGLT